MGRWPTFGWVINLEVKEEIMIKVRVVETLPRVSLTPDIKGRCQDVCEFRKVGEIC